MYSYLCYGLQKGKIVCKVDEIPDKKVRTHLNKVCVQCLCLTINVPYIYIYLQIINAKDADTLQDLLMDDDAGYITASGFHKAIFRVKTEDIPDIVEVVCTEFLIMKSISEINQFQEGLNVLGIGNLIKSNPDVMREVFVYSDKEFTALDLDELFLPMFSPAGSNAREKEEAVILNWKDYIFEAQG